MLSIPKITSKAIKEIKGTKASIMLAITDFYQTIQSQNFMT